MQQRLWEEIQGLLFSWSAWPWWLAVLGVLTWWYLSTMADQRRQRRERVAEIEEAIRRSREERA